VDARPGAQLGLHHPGGLDPQDGADVAVGIEGLVVDVAVKVGGTVVKVTVGEELTGGVGVFEVVVELQPAINIRLKRRILIGINIFFIGLSSL
jgi:hypothetical protein